MANFGLQECHMLEGVSNFVTWKCRLQNLLEEVELWYLVDKDVTPPTNPKDLVEHTKKSVKEKWIVLDLVKDHLILHIAGKKMVKDMYDAFVTLY